MKKLKFKKIDIKESLKNIKEDLVVDKLNAVEWILLGVILLLIVTTLFYGDNLGMYLTYFWINEGLLRGGSIRFLGNNQLSYGIVQQYFCELWVLPVNILYTIFKFEVANAFTTLWFKLSMAFVMTLTMAEVKKLGQTLGMTAERIKWMLILMLSTVLVALPVFHIAQTDILYAFFVVAGIHSLIKKDNKKFIIFFACAVSCKSIAALVFIPLVLMNEKRILFIIRDCILGVIIFPIERIWYKIIDKLNSVISGEYIGNTVQVKTVVDEATTVTEKSLDQVNVDFFSHFYHKMLYFEFPAIRKGYMASLLVVLFVVLCIWCYAQSREKDKEWEYKCIFAASVAWMIFFANASPSPYWIVVMYPCWFILIFMKPERIRINMLLMNAFTLTMFLVYVVNTHWVYGGSNNLDYLFLKGILPEGHDSTPDGGPYVARYLNNMGIESFMNVITAVCLAAVIGLVAVNYHKSKVNDNLTEKEERQVMHGFAIFQIGFLYLWYLINVLVVSRW